MDWRRLDFPTRAGFVATVMAVIGAVIPPIGVASAFAAIAFAGTAVIRARRRAERNGVALLCLAVSAVLIALIVIGNAIYSAAN